MNRNPVTSALLALLVAGAFGTADARGAGGNLAARVDGSFDDKSGAGTFEGTVTLSGFERRGERLFAIGSLDGGFTDAAGKQVAEVEDRPVAAPVDVGSLAASCERAELLVPLDDVEAGGVRARLQPVRVEIGAAAAPKHRLDAPLCELGKVVGPSADLAAVAQGLDRVLAALK
jgi:hypothetical protein